MIINTKDCMTYEKKRCLCFRQGLKLTRIFDFLKALGIFCDGG